MSGICGWSGMPGDGRAGDERLNRMAARVSRWTGQVPATHSQPELALACAGPESDRGLYVDAAVACAYYGTPAVAASATGEPGSRAAMIARVLGQHGADGLSQISGAFALAYLDRRTGETLLAIDRMGISTLTYGVVGECLVFASNADAINADMLVRPAIDRQSIYNYVYFHMVPGPGTIFSGQKRVLPGQCIRFRDGNATAGTYWRMRFTEDRERPLPELREEFRSLLQTAVRDSAGGPAVGAFLSGGTDSSTLSGMLGMATGAPARTYSIGFEAEGYDEMAYARIAAKHFATAHHEYYVTPHDVVAAIPKIAAAHDQPFGNASAVPTYYCAKLARDDGIESMLGGDGGDELYGGNDRYAKQYLYSLYSDLPRPVRAGMLEPVAFLLPEIGIVGKIQRYMRNASVPMPARYDNYNLLSRLGPDNVFTGEFLASIDPGVPEAEMRQEYHAAQARSMINRMLALDLKYTLADNDLPKVTRSCELAGVGARFPMLNDAFVDF